MKQLKLSSLFKPIFLAVVGAYEKPRPRLQIIENMRALGFKEDIIPENRV